MLTNEIQRLASKVSGRPALFDNDTLEHFQKSQQLAQNAAIETAKLIKPGWTEEQAAKILETLLRDAGVHSFFHAGYAWFGERARFDGMHSYTSFMPTRRVLLENEPFILDIAPIFRGYTAAISYSACLGHNLEFERARAFLKDIRNKIPGLFFTRRSGAEIWHTMDEWIRQAGYENIHQRYPLGVLGHRLHQLPESYPDLRLYNFGWQSVWGLCSRGLFGQLLTRHYEGSLIGIWAIGPHIAKKTGIETFGAKFEEILVVTEKSAHWLDEQRPLGLSV